MDEIVFADLGEIPEEKIIALMNNEKVAQYLPLLSGDFTAESCHTFLRSKKRLWEEYGYGPWAILIRGRFAGWGGLQPEHGEADFALILHPDFWGWGRRIFYKIKDHAFNQMNLNSITALLPPARPNTKAIERLGFKYDAQLLIDGVRFDRYRLHR